MGKSASCFKIIACGGDAQQEKDDIQLSEDKRLIDKQGWSFRKRSSRQRVLNNTVIREMSSPGNKESSDATSITFQQPGSYSISEKNAATQCPYEMPPLLATENPMESEAFDSIRNEIKTNVSRNESKVDVMVEESVIIIQTAIRGLLAQQELLKLRKVVKLQAAVRGHLVRRHATETLYCIQAIIKMQSLVRARLARLALARLPSEESYAKRTKDSNSYEALGKENLSRSSVTLVSMSKLFSNNFVQQLLESAPKFRTVNSGYNHSRSETWKWLERWTSFSSVDVLETNNAEFMTKEQGGEKEEMPCASPVITGIDSDILCQSADSRDGIEESVEHSESEDNLITYDMNGSEFQPCRVTSSMKESLEQSWLEDANALDMKETSTKVGSLPSQRMQLIADSQMNNNPHSGTLGTELEQHGNLNRIFSSEQSEVKEKKPILGLRKASNPAFIAAQSKFQELSSKENSDRSALYQDTGAESRIGAISSASDTFQRTEELNASAEIIPSRSRTRGGSECGTELSVTSTLDSPDMSEAGAFEYEHETNITEVGVHDHSINKNTESEVGNAPTNVMLELSQPILESPENYDVVSGQSINAMIVDSAQTEAKPEINASDQQTEQDVEMDNDTCRLSPSASQRSHATNLESQGTPSSQISLKSTKKRISTSRSNQKRKPPSSGKKTLSSPHQNSDSSNNVEPLLKDHKNGKRRNSFGSAKTDHIEEECKESSANQSLPRFMRVTESARAKVQLNNSPRSSPDVQETETFIKKRHSLPGANGRQGSPSIQRSMSQAHQSGKGNERKWQR